MSRVVVFGAGKIADQAYFYLTNDSPHQVVAFTVDADYISRREMHGLEVVPFEDVANRFPPDDFEMFVAVGYQALNHLRAGKYNEAKEKGYRLISYVSSKASNFGSAGIGDNCFVLENTVIQPGSRIGNNVSIWSNNHVGHHSAIEDHCYIAGHVVISGSTCVEPHCFIGVNATIGHEITIGRESIIGAGALITKSTPAKSVYLVQDTPKYRLDSTAFLRITRL